ncbi:16S rRNA (cytosine(967)-C(5))-methyltransferase [Candidatus Legionella polyplacis]|uniref:16S rRNA (cytosine(967)-C(5))-methyltransferase RsmB n=1 Tax=Candidatus Legionella polyplacis TaxID=2005262 RepID=UPI000C1DFDD5|nr:16S rRNA (cytosine(967)-C(5))-methyltransferase RsmB [Candidatus Legionella polyplacis]ATW01778.1 16S rRNA (cytosine(967)-C(5))-methyltransferase [Candidatus Legionella polyplacis]
MNDFRLESYLVLLKVLKNKVTLNFLIKNKKISSLSKEICFGVCREYYRLNILINIFLRKRIRFIEVLIVLLIGIYQLRYMKRVSNYIVIKESLFLLDVINKSWAKSLVNAILRQYCLYVDKLYLENNNDFIFNHPNWYIQEIQKDWPLNWVQILKANDCHPPMSLRVNKIFISREKYLFFLKKKNIDGFPHIYSSVGITLSKACSIKDLPYFQRGYVSVQDESAQIVISLLSLKPGLRVLDACCAPGGKLSHILETESRLLSCVAVDCNQKRLNKVKENLLRLQLKATLIKGNILNPKDWWDGKCFDRILLDVPCSATGVIRRCPDVKILRTKKEVLFMSSLQKCFLKTLWPLLGFNGILVYVTCSVLKKENEEVIKDFLENNKDCVLCKKDVFCGIDTGYGLQILPGINNQDGFFYSVLKKRNN